MRSYRTTLPTPLLISRLPEGSALAEKLGRPNAPKRLDLDGFDAEVRGCALTADDKKALQLPREILAAQPIDTERGRAMRAAVGARDVSPVRTRAWKAVGENNLTGAPAVSPDGKTIYQVNVKSELGAFAREDGAKLWSVPLGACWSFYQPQLSRDGKRALITAQGAGKRDTQSVSLVDLTTREVKWRRDVGGWARSVPAIFTDGGLAVWADHGTNTLTAHEPELGLPVWSLPLPTMRGQTTWESPPLCTPDGKTVLFAHVGIDNVLQQFALDAVSGEVRWKREMPQSPLGVTQTLSPDGKAVITGGHRGLWCHDLESGIELWTLPLEVGNVHSQPVLSPDGRRLAIAGRDGLYAIDLDSRTPVLKLTEHSAFPSLSGRQIAFTLDGAGVVGMRPGGPVERVSIDDASRTELSERFHEHDYGPTGWTADRHWGFVAQNKVLESFPLEKS
jgi:hypothetical protein